MQDITKKENASNSPDLDVSSSQKDNISDFSVQAGQEEVSQSCNENTVDFPNANTSAVPAAFAFVPDE